MVSDHFEILPPTVHPAAISVPKAGARRAIENADSYTPRNPQAQAEAIPDLNFQQFKHAQFPGYVSELKVNKLGDIVLSITVPSRFRDLAMSLLDGQGLPISFDCQPWRPYEKLREQGAV